MKLRVRAMSASGLLLVCILAFSLRSAGPQNRPAPRKPSQAEQIATLKRQVDDLRKQLAEVKRLPGPQGPKGDAGPAGPQGEPGIRPEEVDKLVEKLDKIVKKLDQHTDDIKKIKEKLQMP